MKTAQRLILAMLLCIALLVGIHSAAYAETIASGTCGKNVTWTLDDAGTLSISGSGAMDDYTSASLTPWYGEDIWAVTVEEGVTHVGSYAFSGLFLDNVLLPESLKSIGNRAFYDAAVTEAHFAGNLKQWREKVTLGRGNDTLKNVIVCDKDVTYQGDGFSLANGIVKSTVSALPGDFKREYNDYVFGVVFADVTEIGESACGGDNNDSLTSLTSVTIPEGVTSIGDNAFSWCSSLTSVTIPDSVTSIGECAFYECSNLTSVTIPEGVTSIGLGAFEDCSSLTSVTIPESVSSIGESAFCCCNSLTSVTIPASVTSIRDYAFGGCSSLKSVTIPESVTSIGECAFYECSNLTSVTIPEGVTSIGNDAFSCCNSLTSVTIPASVTSIGNTAFGGCSSLTSVTILEGVTSISGHAFSGCSSLTSVTIPEGVTSIGIYAFSGCSSLTSVTIPESMTSIGAYAFYRCSSLTNVYYTGTAAMWDEIAIGNDNDDLINASLHCALAGGETGDCHWTLSENGTLRISGNGRMADYSEGTAPWYAYRDQITAIEVGTKVTYLGSYAFSGMKNVDALTLPAAMTSVGQNAFSGCALLTSAGPIGSGAAIEFGWNRAIPANAFNGANCLRSLTIPEGVTRMMPSAAANCPVLSSVSLPATLANIQQKAFSGCRSLTEIDLPDSVKTLGDYAFYGCSKLVFAILPESLTTIGEYAFENCQKLKVVCYDGTTAQWNAVLIGDHNKTLKKATVICYKDFSPDLILPASLTEIGEEAFSGGAFTYVKLPHKARTIGQNAFADCPNLVAVYITAATRSIHEQAFGSLQTLVIFGKTGSVAETYAAAHGYVFIPVS